MRRGRQIFFGLFEGGFGGAKRWVALVWEANCGAETGSNIKGRVPSRTAGDMNGLGKNQADADN